MTLTARVFFTVLVLAVIAAAAPYIMSSTWAGSIAVLASGAILGSAPYVRFRWVANAGLSGFALLAVIGIWLGQAPVWQVAALTLALVAWNLSYFTLRLRFFEKQAPLKLESRHIGQLILVGLIGFGAGMAALNIQVNITFRLALLLASGAAFGLAIAVRALIRENERKTAQNAGPDSSEG